MVPGSSSESLALDVALQCQVPPDIVYRAAQLFKVQHLPPPPTSHPFFFVPIFVVLLPRYSHVDQAVLLYCAIDQLARSAT